MDWAWLRLSLNPKLKDRIITDKVLRLIDLDLVEVIEPKIDEICNISNSFLVKHNSKAELNSLQVKLIKMMQMQLIPPRGVKIARYLGKYGHFCGKIKKPWTVLSENSYKKNCCIKCPHFLTFLRYKVFYQGSSDFTFPSKVCSKKYFAAKQSDWQ